MSVGVGKELFIRFTCVSFVNIYQFLYLLLSLMVLRVECRIRLY